MSHKNQLGLLIRRRFLPLFVTQALGAFNDNFFRYAMVMLVTFSGLSFAGLEPAQIIVVAGGIFIFPFFLFSALAGQIADRMSKSRMMRIVKFVEIFLMVLASIGFALKSVPILFALLFLMGAQSAFFGPIKYGILPELLEEDELIGGNGLVEASTFVAILLGTIAGGLMIVRAEGGILVSGGLVGLAVLGYLASHLVPRTEPADPTIRINWNLPGEIVSMIRLAARDRVIFRSIVGISWFWFFGSVFQLLFPIFGKDQLGGDAGVVTLFLATFSIGIGIGSLLCNRLTGGKVTDSLVPFGALGLTVFSIDLFFASEAVAAQVTSGMMDIAAFMDVAGAWRVLIDMTGISIAGGLYIVPLYAIVQKRSKTAERARMIAANNIINSVAMVGASGFAFALLAADASPQLIFLITGLINIPVLLYIAQVVLGDWWSLFRSKGEGG